MNKAVGANRFFTLMLVFVSCFLLLSILGPADGDLKYEEGFGDEEESYISDNAAVDVPFWSVGNYWTYDNYVWTNDTEEDQSVHFEEELTFTVESIEHVEQEGDEYISYNISLEGVILDGYIETSAGEIDINGGHVEGYDILRMNDLAVIESRRFRYYHGEHTFVDLEGWSYMNRSHRPPTEYHDFPIGVGELFWSNTTIEDKGYNRVEVGDNVEERNIDEDIREIGGHEVQAKESVQVPAGQFDSYHINSNLAGDDEGTQNRWYSPDLGRSVKETSHREQGDLVRVLKDYEVQASPNELYIDPMEAVVGEKVTISGQFPEHANEDVLLSIVEGAEPRDDWKTSTDEKGYFMDEIRVPIAQDMTETSGEFSSVGLIAQVKVPQDGYAVSTLIIHHDNSPVFPEPKDGAEDVGLNTELSVLIGHDKGGEMNVTFYDASDDSVIGSMKEVPSGDYARTTWNDLKSETTYEWYALAEDGIDVYESEIWSFTTVQGSNFDVEITSPEEGKRFVEGEEITVEYEVENTGLLEDKQDIVFTLFDGKSIVYEDVYEGLELGVEDIHSDYFTWQAKEEGPGEYEIAVASEDDESEMTLIILGEYELIISVGEGGTTDPKPGIHTCLEGEDVTVTAIPDDGWSFVEWTGDHIGTEKQTTITMDESKEITARFEEDVGEKITYRLTIDVEGGGMTDPEPGEYVYEEGDQVSIEAIPEEHWYFVEWTGDHQGDDEAVTLIMDRDKWITALFEEKEDDGVETYELTVITEGDGVVEVQPEMDEYEKGTEVTLTAIAEEGWSFVEWDDDHGYGGNQIMITMDAEKQIIARFEEDDGVDDEDETEADEDIPGFTFIVLLSALIIALAVYCKKNQEVKKMTHG